MKIKSLKIFIIFIIILPNICVIIQAQESLIISTGPEGNNIILYTEPAVREAYSRIGIELEITNLPWERSLNYSNSGKTDGELFRTAVVNKENFPNLIRVDEPIGYIEFVAFSKDPDTLVNGWESLRPYHLVYARGVRYIDNKTRGMQTETVIKLEQAMKMLHAEHCDIVIADRFAGLKACREAGIEDLHIIAPPLKKIQHPLHYVHRMIYPGNYRNPDNNI